MGPGKGARGVDLEEGAGTRGNVGVVEQALVVAALPSAAVEGLEGHPAITENQSPRA